MRQIFLQLLLLITHIITTLGSPFGSYSPGSYQYDEGVYDYDDDDDNADYVEEDKNKKVVVPVILSHPKHIEALAGQNIILPCTVDKLSDDLEMLWTRLSDPPEIISMGEKVLSPSYQRRGVVKMSTSGSTLTIQSTRTDDEGQYRCSVAVQGENPPNIVHTITVLDSLPDSNISTHSETNHVSIAEKKSKSEFHPSTTSTLSTTSTILTTTTSSTTKPPPESISAMEGDDVLLTCHTTGVHTTPIMYWIREGGKMPTGEKSLSGPAITLVSVSVEDSGRYTCTASTREGVLVSNSIIVNISQTARRSSADNLSSCFLLNILPALLLWYRT